MPPVGMRFKIDINKNDISFENPEVIIVDFSHKRIPPSYGISPIGEGMIIRLLREEGPGRVIQMGMVQHNLFSGNVHKFLCSDKFIFDVPLFLIIGEIKIWESI